MSTTKVTISPTKSQSGPILCDLPGTSLNNENVLPPKPKYNYTVKVMNPGLKRDYNIYKHKSTRFETVDELRDCLTVFFPCGFTQVGYIEPGHGLKGKTQWIVEDDDLVEMYTKYGKHDILLWCLKEVEDQPNKSNQQPKKRNSAAKDTKNAPSAKKPKQTTNHYAEALSEVEKIIQLREKHGTLYTIEQLNCWAHMYHTQKHGSLDSPPNLPYFVGTKHRRSSASKGSHVAFLVLLRVHPN